MARFALGLLLVVGVMIAVIPGSAQQRGRYKSDGRTCVWDANDSGPNQCVPRAAGRFKGGPNNSCVWDGNDNGPDQCRPPKGRWKGGPNNSCTWDGNDDGPDQCNPRQVR
jgi:hypothetical protein